MGICFIDGRKYWKDDGAKNPAGIDGGSGGSGSGDIDIAMMDGWMMMIIMRLISSSSDPHPILHTLHNTIYLIGPTG